MSTRDDELRYFKKLNKTDLLARTMGYYDTVQNNLQLIHELRSEHKAEISRLSDDHIEHIGACEKIFESSKCYKYVKKVLGELTMYQELSEINESKYYSALDDLTNNHSINDLRKENQELRNKIVRMA